MGWHIAHDCPICGKFVTDEDDDVGLYHKKCEYVSAYERKDKKK
jgi:hypothetical protein